MSGMYFAHSYRDLIVYKRVRMLSKELFTLSQAFPRDETYSLTDQLRRASRSVGAQIAEAWGKRRYERSFISKLVDAAGELYETQHWIETAGDCGYFSTDQVTELLDECDQLGHLLGGMISKAALFCAPPASPTVREPVSSYDTAPGPFFS